MAQNNFQDLFDEEEEREINEAYGSKLTNVRGQVWQSLGFFRFVGDIVDAYIPKNALVEIYPNTRCFAHLDDYFLGYRPNKHIKSTKSQPQQKKNFFFLFMMF